jgi:hypothetical protein
MMPVKPQKKIKILGRKSLPNIFGFNGINLDVSAVLTNGIEYVTFGGCWVSDLWMVVYSFPKASKVVVIQLYQHCLAAVINVTTEHNFQPASQWFDVSVTFHRRTGRVGCGINNMEKSISMVILRLDGAASVKSIEIIFGTLCR